MKFSIIKMYREEYCKENIAIRDYKIYFFGIPIYKARFTSTNRDAVRVLTVINKKQVHICGFTSNKYETNN